MTPKQENNYSRFSELFQGLREAVGAGGEVPDAGPKSSPDSSQPQPHIGASGQETVDLFNTRMRAWLHWKPRVMCFHDEPYGRRYQCAGRRVVACGPSSRTAYLNWEAELFRKTGARP